MAVAYKEKTKTKRRGGRGFRTLLLLTLLVLLAAGAYKLTDGFAALHLPVAVDMSNIRTDFAPDYGLLEVWAAEAGGDFSVSPEDADALRAVAESHPEQAGGIEFLLDHCAVYSQTAVNTILLSPEKTDFTVLSPFWQSLVGGAGESVRVTRGVTPFFIQYDSRWAFHGYGSSCMGNTACGPTCLAMAAAGLTGDGSWTPDAVADYAADSGYYVPGVGTAWNLFTDGAAGLGLRGGELSGGREALLDALKSGGVVVASLLPGDFTMAGHFIVIYDWGLGGFKVFDPSSVERSGVTWMWNALAPQIAQCWAIYG